MENSIIILKIFEQRNNKINNIFDSSFDEILIKYYMLSYNETDENNLNTFKYLYSIIDGNEKKTNQFEEELKKKNYNIQTIIFNYYEHYFTFIAEINKLNLNERKISDLKELNLNFIEKLLLKYYECLIRIFKIRNERNNEDKIKKIKDEFQNEIKNANQIIELIKLGKKKEEKNQIKEASKFISQNIENLIDFIDIKFNLFIIENNLQVHSKYHSTYILFDNCTKNAIINNNLKKLLNSSLKKYIKVKGKKDGKIYQFLLRIYYLDKILLENNSYKIIKSCLDEDENDDKLFDNMKQNETGLFNKIIDYIQLYKDKYNQPNQNLEDKKIELKNKIKDLNNENEFVNKLKRTDLNILIKNQLFSKDFLKICFNTFKDLVYPFDILLSYVTLIYNGLICEKYDNDENFNLKNIIIKTSNLTGRKKISANYNLLQINLNNNEYIEYDDESFKRILFDNFINYLFTYYNIYKIKKIANFPIFHLLILKLFLWKINFEIKRKNFIEALKIFYIFKTILVKLTIEINNEKTIKIYALIFETIGDIYFDLKYYRIASRFYKSAIRTIKENETNQIYKNFYYPLQSKVLICKYYCGRNKNN